MKTLTGRSDDEGNYCTFPYKFFTENLCYTASKGDRCLDYYSFSAFEVLVWL